MLRWTFCILVGVLVVFSAFAGGGQQAASTPAPAQVNYNETSTLNLDWVSAVGTDSVFECPWTDIQSFYEPMVFDTLVKIGTDGKTVVPDLAKSVSISPDGKTYTFTLQDNATWHDGTPFTAADVMFSYDSILQVPQSSFKVFFASIEGAQAVMDGKAKTISGISASGNTLTIHLNQPDHTLMAQVFAQIYILPKHLLGNVDPTLLTKYLAYWKKPIGTGAYKIDQVSFPNYFTLIRNDNYFGTKPKIMHVKFISHVTGGVNATDADLIAGNLDFAYGNAVNDINTAKNLVAQNPNLKMEMIPSSYQRQLFFNNVGSTDGKYNTDMQKPEVRQAIGLLLDKSAIADLYKGQAVPLSTFVNPALPAYDSSIPLFKRDVAKAKQMLTQAGFDFSRPVRILYYYNDQTTKDLMALVQQNLADGGVKAEPFLATGDLASIIYKVRDWDIMYAGTIAVTDPILLYQKLVPDAGLMDGVFGDVANRQNIFGKLMTEYKATSDPAQLKKIGDEIQAADYQYAMIVPVYALNKIDVYNSAKLSVPQDIFKMDLQSVGDLELPQWSLLK